MHSALLTADILHEIFLHLRCADAKQASNNAITLARAARVCAAFYEPAIRSLWWAIPGIEPALHLLSTLSLLSFDPWWTNTPGTSSRARLYTLLGDEGDISPANWKRFLRYTSYTYVVHKEALPFRVSSLVYLYLSLKLNGQQLFPNLRLLTWRSGTADPLVLFLLAPLELQSLTVNLHEPWGDYLWLPPASQVEGPSEMDAFFQAALPRLPCLVELQIQTSSRYMLLRDEATWNSIAQLQRLRILLLDQSCPVTSPATLQLLAALPFLVELQLSVSLQSDFAESDIHGFASLEKLAVQILRTGAPDSRCLHVFASPYLHTLSIAYPREIPFAICDAINRAMDRFPHLRCLTIKVADPRTDNHIPTFDAVFGNLMSRSGLEELVIHSKRNVPVIHMDDADLARLARSWPRLRVLSLLVTVADTVTYEALPPFALHCPMLRTLHLRDVDFRGLTRKRLKASPTMEHALEEIRVCGALVKHDEYSAVFLKQLFPKLKRLGSGPLTCPTRCWDVYLPLSDRAGCVRAMESILRAYQNLEASDALAVTERGPWLLNLFKR